MHAQNLSGDALLRHIVDALYPVTPKALHEDAPRYAALDVASLHYVAEAAVAHQHHVALLNRHLQWPRVSYRIEALAKNVFERGAASATPTHFWEAEIDPWSGSLRARRVVFRNISEHGFSGPQWCLPSEMPSALRQEVERVYQLLGDLPRQKSAGSDETSVVYPEHVPAIPASFEPSARSENGSTHPTHCGAQGNKHLARVRIAGPRSRAGILLAKTIGYLRTLRVRLKGVDQ